MGTIETIAGMTEIYSNELIAEHTKNVYQNRSIKINATVMICGEMEFDGCEIIFDDASRGNILIGSNGSLRMTNCMIREAAARPPKQMRIFSRWNSSNVTLDHCRIVEPRNFIGVEQLTLTDCEIENAGAHFLYYKSCTADYDVTGYQIKRSKFSFNKQISLRHSAVIDLHQNKSGVLCLHKCTVSDFSPDRTGGWFIRLRRHDDISTHFTLCKFCRCSRLFKEMVSIGSCWLESSELGEQN